MELSQAARAIQQNPAYKAAFEDVEQDYIKKLLSTAAESKEQRECLYLAIRALRQVKRHIEIRITDSEVYSKVIEKDLKGGF